MAKIIWEGNATQEFLAYVDNAGQEFGKSTAQRWQNNPDKMATKEGAEKAREMRS